MVDIDTVDIDVLLSAALKRVAEPGDPTGVADAIRARMATGDTGTPADGPQLDAGFRSWLPWAGAGLAVAIVGGVLGASGLFGQPVVAEEASAVVVDSTVSGGLCPGGSGAATFAAGTRVLATARTADDAYLAVRDGLISIVWLPAGVVTIDEGDISMLPVDGCLEPVLEAAEGEPAPAPSPADGPTPAPPAPAPGPVPVPQPGPAPAPQPPADTQAPTGLQASASPTVIYNSASTVLTASAVDNVGVASIRVVWSGAASGNALLTKSGTQWQLSFTPPASYGDITFTFTAYDSAGNASATTAVVVSHHYFG